MALNGALAGLVAITAEPLAPTPFGATLIGGVGGLLVVLSIVTLDKLRLDDPVGAISVHGTVGIWGLLAVPIYNGPAKLWVQIVGLLSIFLWVFLMSLLVWFLIRLSVGIRVDEQHEYEGVDLTECGLEAYPEFAVAD
jgi:Amt family ammonium transporter